MEGGSFGLFGQPPKQRFIKHKRCFSGPRLDYEKPPNAHNEVPFQLFAHFANDFPVSPGIIFSSILLVILCFILLNTFFSILHYASPTILLGEKSPQPSLLCKKVRLDFSKFKSLTPLTFDLLATFLAPHLPFRGLSVYHFAEPHTSSKNI
jgi:hypothetical protein